MGAKLARTHLYLRQVDWTLAISPLRIIWDANSASETQFLCAFQIGQPCAQSDKENSNPGALRRQSY